MLWLVLGLVVGLVSVRASIKVSAGVRTRVRVSARAEHVHNSADLGEYYALPGSIQTNNRAELSA